MRGRRRAHERQRHCGRAASRGLVRTFARRLAVDREGPAAGVAGHLKAPRAVGGVRGRRDGILALSHRGDRRAGNVVRARFALKAVWVCRGSAPGGRSPVKRGCAGEGVRVRSAGGCEGGNLGVLALRGVVGGLSGRGRHVVDHEGHAHGAAGDFNVPRVIGTDRAHADVLAAGHRGDGGAGRGGLAIDRDAAEAVEGVRRGLLRQRGAGDEERRQHRPQHCHHPRHLQHAIRPFLCCHAVSIHAHGVSDNSCLRP